MRHGSTISLTPGTDHTWSRITLAHPGRKRYEAVLFRGKQLASAFGIHRFCPLRFAWNMDEQLTLRFTEPTSWNVCERRSGRKRFLIFLPIGWFFSMKIPASGWQNSVNLGPPSIQSGFCPLLFHLFTALKVFPSGHCLICDEEVKIATVTWLA